ncbi:MAG: YwqG family protein [Actinomycetota bacterium]|nr:YwqG family protein [Actinomycetota bacterium]
MSAGSDRRGFLRELLREAAEVVREVNDAIRTELGPESLGEPESWYESSPVPAQPARGRVLDDELVALCRDVALEHRVEDVRRLLRPSLRLTHADAATTAPVRSRLGGSPALPAKFEWPTWRGNELAFLGQFDLAEVAELAPGGLFPPRGLLHFFYSVQEQPSGLEPSDRGSCRVIHIDADPSTLGSHPEGWAWFPEYPLELSLELMLPRCWSPQVEALDLDEAELTAWDELRARLARAHGVELEELTPTWQALHRLFGYPEELGSEIELDCELVAAGVNLSEGEGYLDPRREQLRPRAADWRLLLQLSDDDDLAASWGKGFGRLYFWIREGDLQARSFDEVWAILR